MLVSEFDYHLPEDRIAQRPLADRAESRMLVVHRWGRCWEDRQFRELPLFLGPGDCLALNNTRVFPARLYGYRAGVGSLPVGKNNPRRREYLRSRVEVFLTRAVSEDRLTWEALVRPGRKLPTGERVRFSDEVQAEIVARGKFGQRTLRFQLSGDIHEHLERLGHVPLPPYIRRPDEAGDRERYQTVFARRRGSIAAPTAGLHFTPQILRACHEAGAEIAELTLHVGLGTFQPVHADVVEQYRLHAEWFEIGEEAAERLGRARRVVAVGTTSVRALESAGLRAASGETDLFIYPGFQFRVAGALLTNFHLPKSSLLMLVSAFAGKNLILAAYRHAVEAGYRFYSYGDCMLVL
jgi:S-adenosylmethionine:tRNA ribosyltransferase-isomerase